MSFDFTENKSILVQAMTWCRQAASHCWGNFDPDHSRHIASLGHTKLIGIVTAPPWAPFAYIVT